MLVKIRERIEWRRAGVFLSPGQIVETHPLDCGVKNPDTFLDNVKPPQTDGVYVFWELYGRTWQGAIYPGEFDVIEEGV